MNRRTIPGDPLLTLWGVGYVVVGLIIATALAWPIYQSWRLVLVAGVALLIAALVPYLGVLFRWPPVATAGLVLLAYLLVVVPVAIPSAMTSPTRLLRGVGDGVLGVVVGWKQLLTLSLPLGDYQAVLVPFFILTLLASLIALLLVVRGGRAAPLAIVPVTAMSVFGLVFGAGSSATRVIAGVIIPNAALVVLVSALVLVSLSWLVGRTRIVRARALRVARAQAQGARRGTVSPALAIRRNLFGVALLLLAIGAGVLIAPIAAGTVGERQVVRDRVDPLLVVREQPSPLSGYRAWFGADIHEAEILRIVGDTSAVERIRIATLASYDGQELHVAGPAGEERERFSRVPRRTLDDVETAGLVITIGDGYEGVWVPVPSNFVGLPEFTGERADQLADSFYLGDSSGTAIVVALVDDGGRGVRPGDTYRVGVSGAPAPPELGSAPGGTATISDEDYPALASWVESQEVPRTGTGLAELFRRLSARGYLSHSLEQGSDSSAWTTSLAERADYAFVPSYAGHSVARVEQLFSELRDQELRAETADDAQLVAAIGDDEQFAAAGVLLARYLGFDARVAVGMRLAADPDAPIAPCSDVCTGANVTAWVEVRSPSGDWVAYDVSPQFATPPVDIEIGEQLPQNPTVVDEIEEELAGPPESQGDDAEVTEEQSEEEETSFADSILPVVRIIGLSLLVLAALLLPPLVLFFAKPLRRRMRRTSPVPEVSVVGAWEELVDLYADYGLPIPQAQTRSQFASTIARPGARALAVAVDRAVFAEHPPGRAAGTATWEIVDIERRSLAEQSTLAARVRARMNPRSLLRSARADAKIGGRRVRFSQKRSAG